MIFTKSLLYKLFLLTLVICCLTNVYAGKLTKTKTKSIANTTEDVTTDKSEVAIAENEETEDDNSSEEEEESDDEAEKNAVQPAGPTSLSIWGVVRGVWNWIKDDIAEGLFGGDDDTTSAVGEGRTFGKIRRLQMALIPIIFKFGVLTAMVAFLVAIGLKTLFLVKVLLAMNTLALLAKFFTIKTNFGHSQQYSAPPSWSWSPPHIEHEAPPSWSRSPPHYESAAPSSWSSPVSGGWSSEPAHSSIVEQPTKEIHLHIHGAKGEPQVQAYSTYGPNPPQSNGWERRNDPYSAYETLVVSENGDVSRLDNIKSSPVIQQFSAKVPANHRML